MDIKRLDPAGDPPQDAASGPVEPLAAPPALAWPKPIRSRGSRLAALGAALAAHAGLLYLLMRMPADDLAGGGGQLEAISVTIVSSAALDARDVNPVSPPLPAASTAVDAKDGAVEATPEAPQPQQEEQIKQAERAEVPDRPAPVTAIVEAPMEVPREAETEARKEARQDDRKETGTAAAAGGAPARGEADAPDRPSVAAAASPGAMREYARYVAQALAKARPKGTGSTGTVRIKLAIARGGTLATAEIVRSSGNRRLDELALAAVQRALLPVPPPGATEAQLTYEVPYHFR
jgi:protein TonB